jgi:hypothetical protein
VGSDGLIKTATTNLLLQSEEFDNASWDSAAGARSVSSNSQVAPNGIQVADTVTADGTTASHFVSQSATLSATPYSFSVFAKAGTNNFIQLRTFNAFGGMFANFDLSTGVVGATGAASGATPTSLIQPYLNGWFRCTMVFTPAAASSSVGIYLVDSASAPGSQSNSLSTSVHLWGAQLEQSSTVGEYIPTTSTINSAPRFDHDPTTGESLGLLVEESRTNLTRYSQDLTVTPAWTEGGAGVALAPTVVDVFGGFTAAFKLTENNATSAHSLSQGFTITANTLYSVTAWFKSGSGNRDGRVLLTNTAAWNGTIAPRARIEFSTGTAKNVLGFVTADVIQYPNGWFKFVGTALSSATGGPSAFLCLLSDAGTETYEGDGVSYIYIGPCQLEVGAFPTSYIPTEGSTVTRAADVVSISGSNFSSWYNQSEGTVFAEAAVPVGVSSSRAILSIDDGSNTDRIQIRHNGTTARTNLVVDNSSTQFSAQFVGDSFPPGQYVKLAMASKANDFAAVKTFGELDTDTSGTMPTVNQLQIGLAPSNPQPCKPIKRITYWPVRLPDATLLNITT